jgi:hypothetical protein
MNRNKKLEIIARIGIFGTFLGHGIAAISVNPKWLPLLTCFGFTTDEAKMIMPIIGTLDVVVAIVILIYPIRIVLFWAILWTFSTAIMRPISGGENIEFVERAANWCLPLVLLFLQGFPKNIKTLFTIRN